MFTWNTYTILYYSFLKHRKFKACRCENEISSSLFWRHEIPRRKKLNKFYACHFLSNNFETGLIHHSPTLVVMKGTSETGSQANTLLFSEMKIYFEYAHTDTLKFPQEGEWGNERGIEHFLSPLFSSLYPLFCINIWPSWDLKFPTYWRQFFLSIPSKLKYLLSIQFPRPFCIANVILSPPEKKG